MSRTFSLKDVAEHGTKEAPWIIIHDKVYNVAEFLDKHPGGEAVLLTMAGKDATEAFERQKHSEKARKWMKDFEIGSLGGQPKKWYQCCLYQGIAVAVGIAAVATIVGIAVHRAKHQ